MKRSAVALLPPDIRAALDQELIRRGFGQLDEIVAVFAEHGIALSRSAVGRYSQRLQRKVEAIQASTEAARAIAGITDERDDRSGAAIALVQSGLFDALFAMRECEEEDNLMERVKIQAHAARAIADISRASQSQKRFAAQIEEQQRKKLDVLEADAKTGRRALDFETLRIVRQEIYGLAA